MPGAGLHAGLSCAVTALRGGNLQTLTTAMPTAAGFAALFDDEPRAAGLSYFQTSVPATLRDRPRRSEVRDPTAVTAASARYPVGTMR